MTTISPDKWLMKYIKSTTNGRLISTRASRLLTLILVPIWLLGFVVCMTFCYNGTKSIFTFYELKDKANSDMGDYIKRGLEDQEQILRKMYNNPYLRMRYEAPDYEYEMKQAKRETLQLFALPMYAIIFILMPWIILRVIFWVVDADKAKEMG